MIKKINSTYDNIIWDWNGTLLNDVSLCVDIANDILHEHKDYHLDIPAYRNVFGFPITEYYEKIGVDFAKQSFEAITVEFMKKYNGGVKKCGLHDRATSILDSFRFLQKRQFILTAGHKDNVVELLHYHGIHNYFDEVQGLDNHRAESKVDKGLHLLENNDIDKSSAVLIGDTIHDFEVANEMGINCILIANGHQSRQRLVQKVGREVVVLDHIRELLPTM